MSDLLDLSSWPEGTRAIARREEPHAGAQLSFTDVDGHRFQVCVTDLKDPDVAYLEALYRGRGRAERRICDGKDTGMGKFPSESFSINSSWLVVSLIAQDLLAWTRLLCLDGELSRPSRNGSATASCMRPAPWRDLVGAPGSGSPRPGHGRTSWLMRSAACGRSRFAAEQTSSWAPATAECSSRDNTADPCALALVRPGVSQLPDDRP